MHQTGILSRLIGKQTEISVNLECHFHLNVLNAPCLQWINLQGIFNPELFRLAVQNIAACPFKLKKKWSWKVKYVIKISRNKSISLIPSLFSRFFKSGGSLRYLSADWCVCIENDYLYALLSCIWCRSALLLFGYLLVYSSCFCFLVCTTLHW